MIIGSDLDGVIALPTVQRSSYIPHHLDDYYKTCKLAPLPADFRVNFILTARKERHEKLTRAWLKTNNISFDYIFFTPTGIRKTRDYIIERKATLINNFKIDLYFEDDPKIVKGLKDICDNCKIVEVKH